MAGSRKYCCTLTVILQPDRPADLARFLIFADENGYVCMAAARAVMERVRISLKERHDYFV